MIEAAHSDKIAGQNIRNLIRLYTEKYKESPGFLVRVPSRFNLLGTHIEHRGGYVNYMALDKELWCAAGPGENGRVAACNVNSTEYHDGGFFVERELPEREALWTEYIRRVAPTPGDWLNYIKAAVLYLQNKFPEKNLKGLNLCFHGEIPPGAGLSSSSAVVVAAMLAACKVNGISIAREKLAEMSGEAEWYVGTRGGSGDHAAMLLGRANRIAHLQFFPFRMEYLPLGENLKVVCANSLVEAKKSSRAKGLFNQRIACYEIGFRLIRKNFPEFRDRLKYLRDVNPANLGSQELIYQALKSLPETASREEIVRLLPEENLDVFFETHAGLNEDYRLRDVTAYGICECARGEQCAEFLKQGMFEEFGKLMSISHDGDRIISHGSNGHAVPWDYRVTDAYLARLLEQLADADPGTRTGAQVCYQPGAYRCSTPELDLIVDLARRVPGVLGAKLTGAGLGGCVVILAREEAADRVLENLNANYYRPKGLPDSAFICRSAGGAEILEGL